MVSSELNGPLYAIAELFIEVNFTLNVIFLPRKYSFRHLCHTYSSLVDIFHFLLIGSHFSSKFPFKMSVLKMKLHMFVLIVSTDS